MCFWLHEKGTSASLLLVQFTVVQQYSLQQGSASATVSSSITCICPSSSQYFPVPFFLCPLPTHLYFLILLLILYRAVSLPNCPDILPHSLFLGVFFLCFANVLLCPYSFLFLQFSGVKKQGEISCLLSITPYCLISQAVWAQTPERKLIVLNRQQSVFYILDGQAGKRY